jgi:hypothetical protein
MEEERKIEKWLRAYAKKRRGQAKGSFDLHPATRRMLQDEIGRQAPAPEDEDDSLSLWEVLRQQWAWLIVFTACIFLIATIFMPVVYKAKEKAQNTLGLAQLKQVGAAVQMSAAQNEGRLPTSLDELTNGYLAKNDLSDHKNGKPIVYIGAGKNLNGLASNTVLAYSMENKDTRDVLFANGQTALVNQKKFEEVTNADLSRAVAMNNESSPQSESSALAKSEIANAGNEPAPTMASPASEPSPPAPIVVTAAPEPNSMSEPSSKEVTASGANPASMGAAESPQAITTSSDLAANFTSAALPAMAPPAGAAGEAFDDSAARRQSESPAFQPAAQPQFASQLQNVQNAFQNSVTPSQAVPVLSNFQVQQNGNALRIVDQDGSVYVGSWRPANLATVHGTAEKEGLQSSDKQSVTKTPPTSAPPAMALADNLQAAQNYFFRVHGMNRSLKQSVVFTGSLFVNFALSGNLKQSFGGAVGGGGGGAYNLNQQKIEPTNQAAQLPWSNLRISGTAVINRTNHVEVNALPTPPAKQN